MISKQHGVNPCISVYPICLEDKNEIILFGHLRDDQKAPMRAITTKEPCDKCVGYMQQGVILITVRDGEKGDNPYRTGGFFVVKEEAVKKMMPNFKGRVAFVEDSLAQSIGLISNEEDADEAK